MRKSNKGQTLIEVIAAVAVIMVAMTVLSSAITTALANNRLAKERVIATRLAQEGVEWIRQERYSEVTWVDFLAGLDSIDLVIPNNELYLCIDTVFSTFVGFDYTSLTDRDDNCFSSNITVKVADTFYSREIYIKFDPADSAAPVTIVSTVSWESRSKDQSVATTTEIYGYE